MRFIFIFFINVPYSYFLYVQIVVRASDLLYEKNKPFAILRVWKLEFLWGEWFNFDLLSVDSSEVGSTFFPEIYSSLSSELVSCDVKVDIYVYFLLVLWKHWIYSSFKVHDLEVTKRSLISSDICSLNSIGITPGIIRIDATCSLNPPTTDRPDFDIRDQMFGFHYIC